jgi:hypothetical protein
MGGKVEGMWNLLHAGDWACAHADDETLARIAADLSRDLAGDLRDDALRVAAQAPRNMMRASLAWATLADRLRAVEEHRPGLG